MTTQSMDVAAFLEEQEAIYKEREEGGLHNNNNNTTTTPTTAAAPPPTHDNDHDRNPVDNTHPRRRERDHYDGRRADRARASHDRYLNEREENDERRSRRSRDLADDTDAPAGSDKEEDSANGSIQSRHRSRSPRPGYRRGNMRDYRTRSRSRSGSPRRYGPSDSYSSRHYRGNADDRRRDDRYLDRGDDRRRRDDGRRGNGHRRDGHRGSHRSPDGGRRKTPDPTDAERDRRTVFVQQLAARLKQKELRKFFESAGPVSEVQIVTDRVSNRSKGVGYVEFKDESSVQAALGLTGQKLLGIPVIVQLTEAEKNRQARDKETTTTRNNSQPQTRLYVGNIQFNINEDDLREVFSPWGALVGVALQKEETGRSKGYAFVEYADADSAKQALEQMNNFKLGDRAIRVGLGGDRNSGIPDSDKNANAKGPNFQGSSFSGMGGRGTHAGGSGNFDRSGGRDADKMGGASALDDIDIEGVNFKNVNRDSLMRKLARQDDPAAALVPQIEQKKTVSAAPTATRCILLKNVYDQYNPKNEPDWQANTKEDIKQECDKKYGKVVHIDLALDNNEGEVYLKFETVKGGENAYKSLQGRMFDGRRINAQYVVDMVYNSLYPRVANI